MLDLNLSVAWSMGLTLAVARAGAFVAFCPFIPRSLPAQGRASLAIALGLFIASPVPTPADIQMADLVVNTVINITVGGLIGWFLGTPIHLFQVAGTVIDNTSGITLGSVFDPEAGGTPGPIARAYTLTASTIIVATGGLTIVTQILWATTRVVALDGRMGSISAIGTVATDQLSEMFRRGVELSLPIASVLFVGELAFGLLGRMVPQLNMFLVGLPLKTLLTLSMLGTASVLFPRYVDQLVSSGADTALRMLGG